MNAISRSQLQEILTLPAAERLKLITLIWDSLDEEPGTFPLTEEQNRVLDERLDAYLADPDDVRTWDEIKAGLQRRRA